MPDWEERITRETAPDIRVEHQLRYELAAPAVAQSELWCDLGCGNGIAAAAGLGGGFPPAVVLVDVDEAALEQAAGELREANPTAVRADLSSPDDLDRVRGVLLAEAGGAGGCITCFETTEHLAAFGPLIGLLADLAENHGFTVLLSVPNDAFWSIENPHHAGIWGEGSFEELRRLLPADHVLFAQVPLHGSALVETADAASARRTLELELDPAGVPTHMLAAFGPGRDRVGPGARAVQTDLVEKRRWERQRESDLRFMLEYIAENERRRTYIHELERRLGEPLSGVDPDEQPAG